MNQITTNTPSALELLSNIAPPIAAIRPKPSILYGEYREDDYFWLRDKQNPEVIDYLSAENNYAQAVLVPTQELQETLYNEILGHIKQTDLSVPYREGEYLYYSRTEEGKQYPIQCRKKGSLDAPEEILLDLNVLAEGKEYLDLGVFKVTDDGNVLAYSLDTNGFRQYTLYVKDLRSGELLPDQMENVGSVIWATDNSTLFYTVEDSTKRQYRLYHHPIGATHDELVYEEADEHFNIGVSRTRSRAYLLLQIGSHTTSEVRYLRADQPADEWSVAIPRHHDVEYRLEHHGDYFYALINDVGRNFRMISMPVNATDRENWAEVIAYNEAVMLEQLDFFANHYVVYQRHNGLPKIHIANLQTGQAHQVSFPEPAYEAYPHVNREWETSRVRYAYQSFVKPMSVFEYDMDTCEQTLLKQTEILGGYDPDLYISERLHATAADGTLIPISLVRRRDTPCDSSAPMLLTGYGSYGFAYPVTFAGHRLSLLDRGFMVAIAHIRGGGELGTTWHDAGKMKYKQNTFTDFINSAEYLVEQKYTSPDRLIIEGGSAGGLLMGVVTNMRPDLFHAVISHVPFVDVINTMLDDTLPLTVGEYEEWGNPKLEEDYNYMRQYCPYSNLARGEYPAMLVKTSLNDSQVMYWEPAKYVARLRTLKTDKNPLLLVTNMGAGHGGSSGRYDRIHELALDQAFMLQQVGISA